MENAQADSTSQLKTRWRTLTDKTLPLRYPLFVLLIVVAVSIGQLIEDALDTPTLEMLTPTISIPRWTVIVLALYMLLILRVIQRTSGQTMRDIRPTVQCDDQTFERLHQRMTRLHWRTDLGLALIALTCVIVFFPVLNFELPVTNHPATNALTYLPSEPASAVLIVIAYTLFAWIGLSLLVNVVRLGYALGDLTQKPLTINVFDTDNLLPLGRLALVLSLAPAGVVLILFVGLGTPTIELAWLPVLLASLASVLALILPLRGVHRQMSRAKKSALGELNLELAGIHKQALDPNMTDANRTAYLSNRVNTLVNLRKVVQEGPTWPFQDTVAVGRAVLVASAPIIYTIINEIIRIFLIQPLSP